MKYFIFVYIAFSFWLINPLLGWLAFFSLFLIPKFCQFNLKIFIFSFCLFFTFINITNYDNHKEKGEYIGIVTMVKENYYIFSSDLVNYYIYEKSHLHEVGDILKINGYRRKLEFISLESEFNFQQYLNKKNINFSLYVFSISSISRTFIRSNYLKEQILNNFSIENKTFIAEHIFNENIDYNNSLGITFIISSSGIILYGLDTIFKRILEKFLKEKKAMIIREILLFPIIIFSSFKIGILKAYVLILVKNHNINIKKSQIINALLLINLFHNPLFLQNATFYFSFLIPLFIPYLKAAVNIFSFKFKNIINAFLMELIFIPLQIYFFHNVNILSFLLLYVFKEIFTLFFLIIYILMFLPNLECILSLFKNFYEMFFKIIKMYNITLDFYFNTIFCTILAIIFFILIVITLERNNKKRAVKYVLCFSLTLFLFSTKINFSTSFVAFINVGQGDCTLIHDRNKNILIDTGGNLKKDIANVVLIPFFKKMNIKKIDHIFLSHDDYDHSGALENLINNFQIDSYHFGSDFYKYKIDNLTFYNLNSFGDGSLDNDDSSLIKLKFYSRTYLFCGDISQKIENMILNKYDVSADIIKIAHHGSNTSSSFKFLKAVNPKEAVISVGKNNSYNHPSAVVINNLKKLNIKYHRTDEEGTIFYHENNFRFCALFFYFFEVKYQIVYN